MNLNRMRKRTTRPMRGSQMAFGACLAAVLLAMSSLTAAAAWGARGGLPGTGDKSFNPGGPSGDNHCIGPEAGVDANQVLGISQPLVPCVDPHAGEFYATIQGWQMNSVWETVPADYTPSAPTPLQDFISKVRSVTFVVDPGTKRERSYRYAAQDIIDVRTVRDFLPLTGPDWPIALFLAKLPPLPPGEHLVEQLFEMSARHCDGLGTVPGFNCLPAGITSVNRCPFRVLPRSEAASRP